MNEARGVRFNATAVAAPWRPSDRFPILILGRKRIDYEDIDRVIGARPFLIFEHVSLWLSDVKEPKTGILFPNRDIKLAFFDRFQEAMPGKKIYRDSFIETRRAS